MLWHVPYICSLFDACNTYFHKMFDACNGVDYIGAMKLDKYLIANGLGIREFAGKCRLSPATISRVASGKRATLDTAMVIVKATRGKVTMADIHQNGRAA